MTEAQAPTTTAEVSGMGHSMKRKEDPRFIRGKGQYIEDVTLPNMVWMDIVRSPYAHATIKSIDASEALAMPGVLAVITGKDLEAAGLHWMPTLAGDKQMVLPVDTVMYQSQEVAAVIALTRYQAADAITAVNVDYEPLEVVVDPFKSLEPGAPVLRPDRGPDKANNHIWHWESGDRAAADAALAASDRIIPIDVYIPRIHVASIETCGCIADYDAVNGHLDFHVTSQAPHAYRTVISLVSGIPESSIRVKTHDIGGGFGGKVPVYPGYVIAIVASLTLGRPVKWIEDRSENLQADSFARDYHVHAELGLQNDGKMTGLRVKTLADHGYADAAADPSKYPAGLFNVITGSYDMPAAFVEVDAAYTNKPPGGVAYRCSFRVTEAVHTIERLVDKAADAIGMDPAELRMKNFIRRTSSRITAPPAGSTTRATTTTPCRRRSTRSATATCSRSRPRSGPRASSWASASARSESNILMPRMSKVSDGPAPTISVNVEMPMPISSPRAASPPAPCAARRSRSFRAPSSARPGSCRCRTPSRAPTCTGTARAG